MVSQFKMVKVKNSARKYPPVFTRLPLATVKDGKKQPSKGGIKRSYRYKPGTKALLEIKKLQKSTDLLLRRLPFQKLVKHFKTF